jgi:hypothetical protein
MMDQAPVRRHVNISARSGAQLELRLHWLMTALALRGGYIVATRRRSTLAGRHVAAVAYELPLPKFARALRGERRRGSGVLEQRWRVVAATGAGDFFRACVISLRALRAARAARARAPGPSARGGV